MGRACSTNGNGKPRCRREDNKKMNLRNVGWG
jgi:hypothetical protein